MLLRVATRARCSALTPVLPSSGRTLVTGSAPAATGTGVGRVVLRAVPSLRELYRFAIPEGCVSW